MTLGKVALCLLLSIATHVSAWKPVPTRFLHTITTTAKTLFAIAGVSTTLLTQPVLAADFITTDSGLKYSDVVRGEGKSAVPGDTVRVHYTGWLDNFESDKKFDSSYDRRSPLTFKVGTKQVISGWDEALLTDMPVGTKRDVIIPSDLAYGKRGAGGVIPPDSTLYFKMELVGIGAR